MALAPLRPTDPPSYGPYRLQGRLGAGGMGVVYLAFGPDGFSDGAAVALKVLQPVLAQDEEFRQRFIREVNAARLVSSPYVARVVGAQTDGDPLWMATEYVEGATLAHAVETNGSIPEDRLRGLASDLGAAIGALHTAGLVHRDLKPANVVLAWSGPKLIDFGIAKYQGSTGVTELTQAGMAVGSPMWMSPEVLAGYPATPASDIFGWGMCVGLAGTGRPPFGVGHPNAVAYRISREQPDLDGLSGALGSLVAAALSKDPAARPTARDLGAALGARGLQSTAVAIPRPDGGWTGPNQPGPPPPPEKKNHRLAIISAIAGALLVAAGVVIALLATSGNKNDAGPPPSHSPSATPSPSPSSTATPTASPASTAPSTSPPTTAAPVLASLTQAEAVVMGDDYTPYDDSASNWDPMAPINVILATKTGSADGYNNWAFFFAGNTYIGHDTSDPSTAISVFGRTKTVITLAYQLYAPDDALCCPTAPTQNVRFQYLNGVFTPLDPIPTTDPSVNHR